ncbi:MAG: hypothetical protein R2940_13610 [Syntrophotaleaceae bacterium]
MKRFCVPFLLPVLLFTLVATGCSTSRLSNQELLTTDYTDMTDQELVEYYRQLDDRIAGRESGGGGLGFGLGLGFGFGFDGGAVGLGASKGVGGETPVEALQIKRNDVRLELARRGLEPLPTDEGP